MAPPASSAPMPPIALLVLASALGPFAMHILVPAIPLLSADFAVPYGTAQLVVTLYLVGFSVAQLAYGPLSDRFGRRPPLLAGVALFIVATAACTFAQSIETLLIARMGQAIGGVAGMVLSRAIITDCFGRDRAAAMLGYVTMAIVICSLASPAVGGLISARWGWRMSFALLLVPAAFVLVTAVARLGETNPYLHKTLSPASLVRTYAMLLRQRAFLALAFALALNSASWFAFVASTPFIVVTKMGRPVSDYGFFIVIVSLGYVAGNFLAGRFSHRLGTQRMIVIGTIIAAAGAVLLAVFSLLNPLSPWAVFLPMALSVLGGGIFMPNATATALAVSPQSAGAASGLLGFIQMSLSALGTVLVGALHDGTAKPMLIVVTGTTLVAAAIIMLVRAPAAASKP